VFFGPSYIRTIRHVRRAYMEAALFMRLGATRSVLDDTTLIVPHHTQT